MFFLLARTHSNTLTQTHSNNRYANGDNEEIQKIGTQLLKNILDENSVLDAINRLKKNTAAMTKKGDEKAGEEVRKATTQLAILARAEPNVVYKNGGVPAVLDSISAILKSNKNPSQRNAILDGSFRMLSAMVQNCREKGLLDSILPKIDVVVDFVRNNPKARDELKYALRLLASVAADRDNSKAHQVLAEAGMVEACAGVLKPNVSHKPTCKSAVDALLALSKSTDGSNAIAEHGGTKPVLIALEKIVQAETSNATENQDFSDVILDMCTTLENVSKTKTGQKRLNKDKCVGRLVGAMAQRPGDDEFQKAANCVIANLVDKEIVKQLTLDLVEASYDVKNTRKNLDALASRLMIVGRVSQIRSNSDVVIKIGGADACARILATLSGFKNTEAKRRCLDAAIQGLGLLTKKVDAKTYRAAVSRRYRITRTTYTQTTTYTTRYPSSSNHSVIPRTQKHSFAYLASQQVQRFET